MVRADARENPVRERLLEALVTITAERGLDQVSLREVAAAADVSIGAVQYYCRNKDEMLRMAFEHITSRILGRATAAAAGESVSALIRLSMLEFLPLDDERRVEARVYLAFAARAAVSPGLARVHTAMMTSIRDQCEAAFRLAVERGESRSGIDPAVAATSTVAIVDGLLLHLLTGSIGLTPEGAVAILDAHLGQYLDVAPPTAASSGPKKSRAKRTTKPPK